MKQFDITGMSCAACSARVEKAVSETEGVSSCSVNLLTNSMTVEGTATEESIISAVENAGYGASLKGREAPKILKEVDGDEKQIKYRLISSVVLCLILMYFSMGHSMWNAPVPELFENNPLASGLIQLVLSALVMVVNQKFFISGFKGAIKGAPNMDTLVAMGSGVSFLYSLYAVFMMTVAYKEGNLHLAHKYLHELYFESAAMILTLITVGKMLEEHSKGKTTNAISSLMKLAPKTAVKLADGKESEVPVEELKKGELFVVKPGASIPADGIVREGESAVNESALTGESIPVDKLPGDKVSAATINLSGYMICEAVSVGEDTALSKIIEMVSDAAATKAPIAKIANKVSGIFVPVVILISVITCLIWLIAGETIGFALARGISVLVISCPCALGLATPVAIMVGNGMGAKNGILFKTAEALEETGRANTVVMDKTGTVTTGNPEVTDVYGSDKKALLKLAYSLEKKSEHPLAKAIIKFAEENNISPDETTDFQILSGNGLTATVKGEKIFGGKADFVSSYAKIIDDMKLKAEQLAEAGKTPLFFGKNNEISGLIAVADMIKETSKQAVSELENMGIKVVMLTGDNEKTAKAVAASAGISDVVAEVLPDEKEKVISKLKKEGKVIMVGDGINDAPALTSADIGIAIGAGTDIAIDAADVVLVKNSLNDIPAAIRLSRAALRNIKENLFWAFCYNIIGIPLAAGAFIQLFNWKLNPMFGAAAMSISSFLVVSNALRLNFFDIYKSKKDKKMNAEKKEKTTMEKTLKIEGMMCPHCEARVKANLEEIDGVISVTASHESKTAVIILEKDVSDEILIKTVEEQGYSVI